MSPDSKDYRLRVLNRDRRFSQGRITTIEEQERVIERVSRSAREYIDRMRLLDAEGTVEL